MKRIIFVVISICALSQLNIYAQLRKVMSVTLLNGSTEKFLISDLQPIKFSEEVISTDYSRSTWTMTASHALPIVTNDPEKNSLNGALDEDETTHFCMVRPGKSYGTSPNNVAVSYGEAIYFTIDMQTPQLITYFRIRHKNITDANLRWNSFDAISGSNDGVNFTTIATNVVVKNAEIAANQESPNIAIPPSTYRYIRFYAKSANCFSLSSYTSAGVTTQIQELYLGK